MTVRYLFPWIYVVFLVPVFGFNISLGLKTVLVLYCVITALFINKQVVGRMMPIMLVSLSTLIPLIGVAQWAVCSSQDHAVIQCAVNKTMGILATFGLGTSVLLLAAANEWCGSLINTVNGLFLPRRVRMISIIGSALIGEFRKAMVRAHHAFAARGWARPSLHWSNVIALPAILGCVWAAVLKMASDRLNNQWSSQEFWDRYVPAVLAVISTKMRSRDVMIIAIAGIVAATVFRGFFVRFFLWQHF